MLMTLISVEVAVRDRARNLAHIEGLRDYLKTEIERNIPEVRFNGSFTDRLPNNLSVSFKYVEGEAILLYLDLLGVAASTGSACASASLDPSHVLMATGLGPELAHGSIRFSFGKYNTEEEVDYVLEHFPPVIQRLRMMSTVSYND